MKNFTKIHLGVLGLLLCLMSSCANSNYAQLQRSNELTIVAAEEPVKIEKIEAEPVSVTTAETKLVAKAPEVAELTSKRTAKIPKKRNHLNTAEKLAVAGVKAATVPIAIAKKATASIKEKQASTIEGNLRIAIILFIVGLIALLFGELLLSRVFNIIAAVFFVLAFIFLLLWLLEYI